MPSTSMRMVTSMNGMAACLRVITLSPGASDAGRGASYCCRPAGTSSESTEAVPGAMMRTMTEWLETARAELNRLELPGWLIYDFRGLNRIAGRFLRLGPGMLTRRVFLYVPAEGRPTLLVHAIERGSLPADLPVDVR